MIGNWFESNLIAHTLLFDEIPGICQEFFSQA
jgi:hypothetical protein